MKIFDYIKTLVIIMLAIYVTDVPVFALEDTSGISVEEVVQKDKLANKINFEDVLKQAKAHSYDLKIDL